MNFEIFVLVLTFSCVNAVEKSSDKDAEKTYPPIKFVMKNHNTHLLLCDESNLKKTHKFYCVCPKDGISELAHQCTDSKNDYCEMDYTPQSVDNLGSCGPETNGYLRKAAYIMKLDSNDADYYSLNVFDMCINRNQDVPEFAFASYNILPSQLISNPTSDSISIPKDIEKLYDEKTAILRKKFQTNDFLVPQRIIPLNSMPNWFSKGVTDTPHNLMPQFKGKFNDWNRINNVIQKNAEDNDFTVITGVSSKPKSSQVVTDNILDDFQEVLGISQNAMKNFLQRSATIPNHWWTIIMNRAHKKGIVLVMDNKPEQLASTVQLCPEIDLNKTVWKDIKDKNQNFIYACELTSTLFQDLINLEDNIEYSLFDEKIPFGNEGKCLRSLNLIYG